MKYNFSKNQKIGKIIKQCLLVHFVLWLSKQNLTPSSDFLAKNTIFKGKIWS